MEKKSNDNWDYPQAFQVTDNLIYILSSLESKIVCFDKETRREKKYNIINKYLINDKLTPIFLQVSKNNIAIGYDFKIVIFSLDEKMVYEKHFESAIQFITIDTEFVYVWDYKKCTKLDLKNKDDSIIIVYPRNSPDFGDIVVEDGKGIVANEYIYNVRGNSIIYDSTVIPYNIVPQSNRDNLTLHCASPRYFIYYPWHVGSILILVDRITSKSKIINFKKNITSGTVGYLEDKESGLRIRNYGNNLYFLIMQKNNKEKIIKIFSIDL